MLLGLPLISLVVAAAAAAPAAAPACGPLDFDGAVAVAAQNADEIAIQKAELAAAEADLTIARAARLLPSVTLTFLTGLVPEAHTRGPLVGPGGPVPGTDILNPDTNSRSLRGLGPFWRADVEAIQPIYTWGRLDAARDAATAGVKARGLQVTDKMAELKVRIAQLFWGENLARRLLGIASDVEKSLADVDKKLNELLKSGDESVKPADRYRLDVYKATLRKRKAEAQKGMELAHGGLAATMGFPAGEVALRELPLPLEAGDVPDVQRAVDQAERQRPDLRALGEAIAARDAEVHAAHAAMLPQIFVGGNFSWAYAPNRTPQDNPWIQDTFNHVGGGVALGFRQDLALPLLITQSHKAAAQRETLKRQRDGVARLVEQQVEAAVSEVRAARERLLAAMDALTSGKSWFRSAGLDFEAGVGEPKDVLEAYAGYIELQVDQQQAAYDLLVTRARLDQVTGVPPHAGPSPCVRGSR